MYQLANSKFISFVCHLLAENIEICIIIAIYLRFVDAVNYTCCLCSAACRAPISASFKHERTCTNNVLIVVQSTCPSLAYVIAIIFHLLIKYVVRNVVCCLLPFVDDVHFIVCHPSLADDNSIAIGLGLTHTHTTRRQTQNDKYKQHEITNDGPCIRRWHVN